MTGRLVFQAPRKIMLHPPTQAFFQELRIKLLPERRGSDQTTRIQQGRFDHRFALRPLDSLRHRAAGVSHLETDVPKNVENLPHHLLLRLLFSPIPDEDQIHIAGRTHLLPPEAAHRAQNQTAFGFLIPSMIP